MAYTGYNEKYYRATGQKVPTAQLTAEQLKSVGQSQYIAKNAKRNKTPSGSTLQLPDRSSDLANQAGQAEEKDLTSQLTTSQPALREVDRSDIDSATRSELSGSRAAIESKYGREIADFREQADMQKGALEGQLGTRRRFDTAATAFITFINEKNNKTIATLESQKEEALANFDFKLAQLIDQRVASERQAAQQEFANAITMMELQEKQRKEKLAEQAPTIQASREAAIFGLVKQGVEDPVEIADLINFDNDGKQVGDFSIEEISKTLDKVKQDKEEVDKIIVDLGKNGAPPEIIDKVSQSKSLTSAVKAAGDYLVGGTGIVGEYSFYKRDAMARGLVPVDFNTYQNMDANRKQKAITPGGLTTTQSSTFLRISDKFQADEVMKAASSAKTALDIADRVIANPGDAGGQLSILYTLVKNLDTASAVKEGEIDLVQQTQSYAGRFGTTLEKIGKGKVISDSAAKALAEETKKLAGSWYEAAQRREKQYKSQANTAGVGDAFNQYLTDFDRPYAATGNELIEDEQMAESRLKTYLQNNPAKAQEIDLRISTMEESLGRPISSEEFLQAFPEYK